MRVFELFQQVKVAEVEKIMKEKWFSYLWEYDEDVYDEEVLPDNYVRTTFFTLWNTEPNTDNTDIVSLLFITEDDYTYREAYIEDEKGETQGYLLRTWRDFLGLHVAKSTLKKYSLEQIAAVLIASLPENHTQEEIDEIFELLNADFRESFKPFLT